ncbi:single-stranded DNA-binding protein [Microbacterium sp. RD1]|uniref:single-stranded DNA-binding protein n=1 Tax=Microbacterium sp. RD1 TaxID=3457313 RepID=UPI003FA614E0
MTEIITVTGNLTADPEQRPLGNGTNVTSFRVAAPHRRFDRGTGQWVDQYTNFFSVSAFRSLGAHALTSLKKGDRVIVVGRLHLRAWDNGTRSGTSADIDADAIGHDLLFGSTTYHPDGRREPAATTADETTARDSGGRDADGWTIPAGALVGVGGEEVDAAEPDPTPF